MMFSFYSVKKYGFENLKSRFRIHYRRSSRYSYLPILSHQIELLVIPQSGKGRNIINHTFPLTGSTSCSIVPGRVANKKFK